MSELYGLADDERLSEDMGDVVERVLDDACEKAGESFDVIADRIEWPIRVCVFRRRSPSAGMKTNMAKDLLDTLLERLDEEYSDPDGDSTDPTPEMGEAAKNFVEFVANRYFVWSCEPTGSVIEVTRAQAKEYE